MNLDAKFSGSIYRQDWANIIASDRHLAKLIPCRFQYSATPILAGTAVGRRTSTGYYHPYNDSATGGEGVMVGVLLETLDFTGATGAGAGGYGTKLATVVVGGCPLFYDNLTGLDANGLADVKARKITDARGVNLLVW